MNIYKKETNALIENSLKTNLSELVNVDSYNEFKNINFAFIKITLSESGCCRDGMINFMSTPSTPDYLKIFKTYSIGKFLIKDYRKDTKDSNGNIPYYIVKFDYKGNPVKALLREIFEDDSDLKSKYSDVIVNDKRYTVIKITKDCNSWLSDDGYRIVNIAHENTPGDIYLDRMFSEEKKEETEIEENTLF